MNVCIVIFQLSHILVFVFQVQFNKIIFADWSPFRKCVSRGNKCTITYDPVNSQVQIFILCITIIFSQTEFNQQNINENWMTQCWVRQLKGCYWNGESCSYITCSFTQFCSEKMQIKIVIIFLIFDFLHFFNRTNRGKNCYDLIFVFLFYFASN